MAQCKVGSHHDAAVVDSLCCRIEASRNNEDLQRVAPLDVETDAVKQRFEPYNIT